MAIMSLPLLRQNGLLPPQETKLEDPVPEFPALKVKDLPLVSTKDPENFYHQCSSMLHQTKASSALIFNTFHELEPDILLQCHQFFSIPIFPIGPFHKHIPSHSITSLLSQDHSSLSWLNSKPPNSVLYVSFGSLASVSAADFLEIASALANCALPFLWVVRPGMVSDSGAEWLEPRLAEAVGERGLIVKWAPQREVLAHAAVGAFWTHGGWNSTLESICEGVPMLCYPYFGDQMANSRYVSDVWRIGVRLEGKLERGEIEKMIRKLMEERESGEMIERLQDLKNKVEGCLREGGSSFNSLESLVNLILKA